MGLFCDDNVFCLSTTLCGLSDFLYSCSLPPSRFSFSLPACRLARPTTNPPFPTFLTHFNQHNPLKQCFSTGLTDPTPRQNCFSYEMIAKCFEKCMYRPYFMKFINITLAKRQNLPF